MYSLPLEGAEECVAFRNRVVGLAPLDEEGPEVRMRGVVCSVLQFVVH